MFCDANGQIRIFYSCCYCYCYCHYLGWPPDVVRFFTWSFRIYTMMSSSIHTRSLTHTHMDKPFLCVSNGCVCVCKLLIQRIRVAMICYTYAVNRVRMLSMCVRLLLPANLFLWVSFHTAKFLFKMSAWPHLCSFIREHAFSSFFFFFFFFLSGVDIYSR